jgi:hypothetical protein
MLIPCRGDHANDCSLGSSYNDLSILLLQDPNKPKRAMSAFFLYSQAYRSQVKVDHPEATFGDTVSRQSLSDRMYRKLAFATIAE